jgi:Fur family ferric uptake transcriptional regulator
MCRDCESVVEADLEVAEPFARQLRERFGFETDLRHFAIFGRCRDCAAGRRPDAAR